MNLTSQIFILRLLKLSFFIKFYKVSGLLLISLFRLLYFKKKNYFHLKFDKNVFIKKSTFFFLIWNKEIYNFLIKINFEYLF